MLDMKEKKKAKIGYCHICEEYTKVVRKPIDHRYYTLLLLFGFMTVGLSLFIYAIYRIGFAKKEFCPYCEAKLKHSDFID